MVNFRIISKIIGSLLFIEAFFMSWCAIMAIFFHEDDQVAFMMSMLVTLGFGFIFLFFGRNAENLSACNIGMGDLLTVWHAAFSDSWQHHEFHRCLL